MRKTVLGQSIETLLLRPVDVAIIFLPTVVLLSLINPLIQSTPMLQAILLLLLGSYVSVLWWRLVLKNERPKFLKTWMRAYFWKTPIAIVLLILPYAFVFWLVKNVFMLAVLGTFGLAYVPVLMFPNITYLMLALVGAFINYLFFRFSVILPVFATGGNARPGSAWQRTAEVRLEVFFCALFVALVPAAIQALVPAGTIGGWINSVVTILGSILFVNILTIIHERTLTHHAHKEIFT